MDIEHSRGAVSGQIIIVALYVLVGVSYNRIAFSGPILLSSQSASADPDRSCLHGQVALTGGQTEYEDASHASLERGVAGQQTRTPTADN